MTGPPSSSANSGGDGKTRVLQATDIVELIGQSVKLKRLGTKYKGLCPFHQEKTPSFTVDPSKQYFYCFGCKANGNAIDFVMKRDRLEFVEALQLLARQANIELKQLGVNKQNTSERQVLLEAHSAACGLFEKLLSHPQIGAAAREYLAGRKFNQQTLEKFQVGFVPDGWDNLLRSQAMKKFTPQQLATAGLVKARDNGGYYDTFRNRIMFPIRDEQGRIIAFGGRVMPGSEDPAKYLNSPETPLFSKGRCVFGLDLARPKVVESRTVAVVEGYTDVMMAHQYGATNVVSVLGTAMTEQHVAMLRRFADRIVLLFDADTAGDLAVNRAVELFLTQPIEIAIASMPEGVDPDEYLIENGVEAFDRLLTEGAQDALAFKWKQLDREFRAGEDLTSRQKAVEQYLELLASARGTGPVDPLRWGAVLTRVSRLTEIPAEELNRRFRTRKRTSAKPQAANPSAPLTEERADESAGVEPQRPATARDRAEQWLLAVLLAQPKHWTDVQQFVQPQDFTDARRRKLAEVYWTHQRGEGEPVFNELLAMLGDDQATKNLAISLVAEFEGMENLDQTLNDALLHLKQSKHRQDEKKLVAELRRTSDAPRPAADEVELLRQLQERARQPDIRRTSS